MIFGTDASHRNGSFGPRLFAPARTVSAGLDARVEVKVGSAEVVDSYAGAWSRLCDEAANDKPFYRPEWIRAYLRHFAPRATVVLITCSVGERLTGVLPLTSSKVSFCGLPVRMLQSASNAHSCRFDLLRAAGPDGDIAVNEIWRRLESVPWDVLHLQDVPENGALIQLVRSASEGGHPVGSWESMRTPILPLPEGGDGQPWFAQTTSMFRGDLRRKARRLAEQGPTQLRHIAAADEHWLQVFYDLERSGWKGAAGTAIGCDSATRAFYDEIAAVAAGRGWFSLYFLMSGDKPLAAQYGLTYRGRFFMPKIAMDESYKPYGPGHQLIEAVLRDCVQRGVSAYDFIGPWSEYKAKWTREALPHSWLWVFRKSAYGHLLHGAKFTIRPAIKRFLSRFEAHPD